MGIDAPQTEDAPAGVIRDADHLAGAWPERRLVPGVIGREARFQVVFADWVIQDIRDHGLSSPDAEVCGVLVGEICRDESGPYCDIRANIRGNHAAGRNAQVTFTSETWNYIHETMDSRYPDQRIVGWYHTHPGFGIFLSEMDVFIQENFFGESWQVAYVDDPKGGDRGVFVWDHNVPTRRPHLICPVAGAGRTSVPAEAPISIDSLADSVRGRAMRREQAERRSRRVRVAGLVLAAILAATVAAAFWRQILHFAVHHLH